MSHFISNAFQVPNAVIDDLMANISPNALKCYLLIVRKTTGWGKTFDRISESQFMDKTGIKNVKTVRSALVELVELGLIHQDKNRGQITEYSLVLNNENQCQKMVVPKNGTSTKKRTGVVPKNGTTTSTKNWHPTKDTIKTTITKEKNTKKDFMNGSFLCEDDCPAELNQAAWGSWLEYRKKVLKKPYKTERGERSKLTQFLNITGSNFELQQKIVDQSIDEEWQGLFPLKVNKAFAGGNPVTHVEEFSERMDTTQYDAPDWFRERQSLGDNS